MFSRVASGGIGSNDRHLTIGCEIIRATALYSQPSDRNVTLSVYVFPSRNYSMAMGRRLVVTSW